MRVLVTGSGGYIGAVLCRMLQTKNLEVVGLDTGYFESCDFCVQPPRIPTIKKDIRSIEKADIQGFDAIIHLAALSNDPLGSLDETLTEDINTRASLRLAAIAKEQQVKRFIFSSSCSIYGAGKDFSLNEDAQFNPQTPYARSKVDVEAGLRGLASDTFSPVFLRNATAFGFSPRIRFDLVVNNLAGWAFTTGKIKMASDGTPWRPLVHVNDIARAFLFVLDAPQQAVHLQAYNIGYNDQNFQIRDIAFAIQEFFPHCSVEFGQPSADTRTYHVDFTKFHTLFPSFQNGRTTLKEGIKDLLEYFAKFALSEPTFKSRLYTRLEQIRYLQTVGKLDEKLYWK